MSSTQIQHISYHTPLTLFCPFSIIPLLLESSFEKEVVLYAL